MSTVETKKARTGSNATATETTRTRAKKATTTSAKVESPAAVVRTGGAAKGRRLTPAHKNAIAAGRGEAIVVRRYLEALSVNRPKPGRKRTVASMEARLALVEAELAKATGVERLKLVQERLDLQAELAAHDPEGSAELESGFIAVAASYSRRRGISREAWRELGVPVAVLRQAGI